MQSFGASHDEECLTAALGEAASLLHNFISWSVRCLAAKLRQMEVGASSTALLHRHRHFPAAMEITVCGSL